MVLENNQREKVIMTIDEEIEELEKQYKYSQKCVTEYAIKWNRFRRIPFLSKFYKNMYRDWNTRMHDLFRELREVMQKEYPERFIGVNS